jgi:hypothetical protein
MLLFFSVIIKKGHGYSTYHPARGKLGQEGGSAGRNPASTPAREPVLSPLLASSRATPAQYLPHRMLKITFALQVGEIFHAIISHTSYPRISHMEVHAMYLRKHTHIIYTKKWQLILL